MGLVPRARGRIIKLRIPHFDFFALVPRPARTQQNQDANLHLENLFHAPGADALSDTAIHCKKRTLCFGNP
jgi:hypothetical protein